MKIIKELLDYTAEIKPHHIFLCTTNTVIKKNGELVMGRGNAKAFAEEFQGSARIFAEMITAKPRNLLLIPMQGGGGIGAFQTKNHWRDPSTAEIIKKSVQELNKMALKYPDWVYHLPFPGIGNGGMSYDDVYKLLYPLPHNVLVYQGK